MNKEFISVFQITKTIMFDVNYYTLGNNENPYFSTSTNVFARNKRDYTTCGQCQLTELPKNSLAMKFYKKWDSFHLTDLTLDQHSELKNDIEELKLNYNNIVIEKDTFRNLNSNISFYDVVELSKLNLKKNKSI